MDFQVTVNNARELCVFVDKLNEMHVPDDAKIYGIVKLGGRVHTLKVKDVEPPATSNSFYRGES